MDGFPVLEHSEIDTDYVDWVITAGGWGGIVNITLGTIIHDPDGVPIVKAANRMRMTAAIARNLAAVLMRSAEQSESSAQSETPPANAKLN